MASSTPGPSASAPGASQLVTLVTGDVVSLTTEPDGRQLASVVQQSSTGPGAQFQMFNLGSDLYVVPESAVPYLGSTLDLSLFDVTKLAASGTASSTVQVTYRTGTATETLPGITSIHRSGATARGVVTSATGPQFGAALVRQWRADHASPTHTTGLFASVARISTAGAATPSAAKSSASSAQPGFVMSTLTIKGINGNGGADTGDNVVLYNVDNFAKYHISLTFRAGLTKVSVPNGHYAALASFVDFNTLTIRVAAMPQFTVAGGKTTITLDARDATAPVSVTTPKPATPAFTQIGIGRTDRLGQTGVFSAFAQSPFTLDVQPTTKNVTIGQLHYFVYTRAFAADDSYSYDLDFPTDGAIPADEHYAPQDSDLAAVESKYPASHAGTQAADGRFPALPWELAIGSADIQFTTPIERTEYYTAFPNLSWSGFYDKVFRFTPSFVIAGQLRDDWHTYQPGTNLTTTWGDTPAGPRLLQAPIFVGTTICPACINGTTLNLLAYPYGDSSPNHVGFEGLIQTDNYSVFADDALLAQGSTTLQKTVTVPSSAQTYRIDYNTNQSSPDFLLSTATLTRWTVPAAAPTASLPAGWFCNPTATSTDCRVVPLITNSYHLPVNMLGQLPPGSVAGQLDLGHLTGVSIDFSSVQANVSYDSGQTWQPVTVTNLGSGQFGLAFTVPPPSQTDGYGALQVSVRDGLGGTFDQTIQHAFAIGS